MRVGRLLWSNDISAEYSTADNPKLQKQMNEVSLIVRVSHFFLSTLVLWWLVAPTENIVLVMRCLGRDEVVLPSPFFPVRDGFQTPRRIGTNGAGLDRELFALN